MSALTAYRNILRATRVAFQGDHRVLVSAREQVKKSFYQDRYLDVGSEDALKKIEHAEAVAKFLRQNLVQGEKVEDKPEEDRYKLNVHNETERGDNDFNRLPKKDNGSLQGVGAKSFKSS